MLAGTFVTRFLPEQPPLEAYAPAAEATPARPVFEHANWRDASRDLTGIDVDVRRLLMFGRIC
jgi:hypothetical protein